MRIDRLARYAWGVLAFNLVVIVWGAYVRASGSGAGCGSHWPLCNGEVVPRAPRLETIVELTHRVTSGLALLLVVGLVIAAYRWAPPRHPSRRAAVLSLVFILTEALIGAGLVLFEHVAKNASMKRGFSVSLHLANTFVLLACLTATVYFASGGRRPRAEGKGPVLTLLGPALVGTLVLGTSGAIAALGDTLFPARSLSEGLLSDFSATAHLFVRLRVLHPFLATGVGVYVVGAATATRFVRRTPEVQTLSRVVVIAYLTQFGAGLANLFLLAPIPMQLVHLLLADAVWISLVLLTLAAVAEGAPHAVASADDASSPGALPA